MSSVTPPGRPGSPTLAGRKTARPHRIVLSTGRTLTGSVFRDPNVRLSDHLAGLKGFLPVTDVVYADTGETHKFIVVNIEHLVTIEELA